MNVLEKILEEVYKLIKKHTNEAFRQVEKEPLPKIYTERDIEYTKTHELTIIRDIIRSHMNEATSKVSDDLIDRKALKEKIESLTMMITGMRSGKTMTTQALEEYKKSILRIIDEQPTVHANDNWIPVEERVPETDDYILISFINTRVIDIGRYVTDEDGGGAFYPGDEDESYSRIGVFVNAWQPLPKPYRPDPCHGCFGAANNDCGKCEYGGGNSE